MLPLNSPKKCCLLNLDSQLLSMLEMEIAQQNPYRGPVSKYEHYMFCFDWYNFFLLIQEIHVLRHAFCVMFKMKIHVHSKEYILHCVLRREFYLVVALRNAHDAWISSLSGDIKFTKLYTCDPGAWELGSSRTDRWKKELHIGATKTSKQTQTNKQTNQTIRIFVKEPCCLFKIPFCTCGANLKTT